MASNETKKITLWRKKRNENNSSLVAAAEQNELFALHCIYIQLFLYFELLRLLFLLLLLSPRFRHSCTLRVLYIFRFIFCCLQNCQVQKSLTLVVLMSITLYFFVGPYSESATREHYALTLRFHLNFQKYYKFH